ncbi:FAD/NAD(P)-binding oxidoreductase family protein [Thalictrum thalictroides]|uniref:FAD/NAD(P)-binding oxidoreductase family protein n=1 Tax=Thalictrum thalictroides TaxID=46969 RepID=A0A7J6V498_THATH|nr:FAD/NAD(P)-binding oxidoreductase family protein [Thalictrum thalictroides]
MNLIFSPLISKPSLLFPSHQLIHKHNHHYYYFKFKPHYYCLQTTISSPVSNTPPETKTGVIIVGAGLAGLAAATHLNSQNIPFILVEASDAVGGRVRTDEVDGFLLDRGFQIFITGYPEAKKILDYDDLDLQKFYSGAFVYFNGGFHTVADPLRHFSDALLSLTNPIGSVFDKLLIGLTRIRVLSKSDEELLSANEISIIDLLKNTGFSSLIIDRFFRPFFGGIFFDKDLETSSRLFDFIFKCLALGDNTLPAKGISAIPEQLARKLPSSSILLNSKVASIEELDPQSNLSSVKLQNGKILKSEFGIIIAVEEPEAEKLLAGKAINKLGHKRPVRSTACLYFSADQVPINEPVLLLNGSSKGIVNNMFFATNVARSYGPLGKTLVSVSVIGTCEGTSDEDLTAKVLQELSGWFGDSIVRSWKHLRTYRIEFAQPNQCPPTDLLKSPKIRPGLYMCGDHWNSATFDGALVSGRRAAEALLKDKTLVSL